MENKNYFLSMNQKDTADGAYCILKYNLML